MHARGHPYYGRAFVAQVSDMRKRCILSSCHTHKKVQVPQKPVHSRGAACPRPGGSRPFCSFHNIASVYPRVSWLVCVGSGGKRTLYMHVSTIILPVHIERPLASNVTQIRRISEQQEHGESHHHSADGLLSSISLRVSRSYSNWRRIALTMTFSSS